MFHGQIPPLLGIKIIGAVSISCRKYKAVEISYLIDHRRNYGAGLRSPESPVYEIILHIYYYKNLHNMILQI